MDEDEVDYIGGLIFKDNSKAFLNLHPEEFGSICWDASSRSYKNSTAKFYGSVRIADCSKSVILDFDCYGKTTQKTVDKRIEKLDTLISELQKFRESYLIACETTLKYNEEHQND